jgi:hypothetical protein
MSRINYLSLTTKKLFLSRSLHKLRISNITIHDNDSKFGNLYIVRKFVAFGGYIYLDASDFFLLILLKLKSIYLEIDGFFRYI